MPGSPGAVPRSRPAGSPQRLRSRAGMNARVVALARARASVIGEFGGSWQRRTERAAAAPPRRPIGSQSARVSGAITRPRAFRNSPIQLRERSGPLARDGAERAKRAGEALSPVILAACARSPAWAPSTPTYLSSRAPSRRARQARATTSTWLPPELLRHRTRKLQLTRICPTPTCSWVARRHATLRHATPAAKRSALPLPG